MKLTLIKGDYWEGLYRDGKIVDEGHVVPLEFVMKYLERNLPIEELEFSIEFADIEWLNEEGSLPSHLLDVKFYND